MTNLVTAKENVISEVIKRLNEDDFDFKITILGSDNTLGIDTTSLFKLLPPEQQYHHGVKVMAVQPPDGWRRGSTMDPDRKLRKQDVVVTGIPLITEKRIRADVTNETIVLSVAKAPKKVLIKRKDDLMRDFESILKLTSKTPSIN